MPWTPQARGHATELCREAAHEGYDVVVAFGGDGTVNEAANGLLGSPTPLTCLPGGSANVFGKMLGIPGELVDATEHLLGLVDDWQPRKVDLGLVNGRRFDLLPLAWASTRAWCERVDANPRLKARYGPWFFTWAAIATFSRRYLVHPPRLIVDVEMREDGRASTCNSRASPRWCRTAPRSPTSRTARSRSPRMRRSTAARSQAACCTAHARSTCPSSPGGPSAGARVWRATATSRAFSGVTELVVRSADERPLPLQVDGDYLGEVQEARYSIVPQALSVIA